MVETRTGLETNPDSQEQQEKMAALVRESRERKEREKQAKLKAIEDEQVAKMKRLEEEMKKVQQEEEERRKAAEAEAAAEEEKERMRIESGEGSSGGTMTRETDTGLEKKISEWVANLSFGEEEEAESYVTKDEKAVLAAELAAMTDPMERREREEEQKLAWKPRMKREKKKRREEVNKMTAKVAKVQECRAEVLAQPDDKAKWDKVLGVRNGYRKQKFSVQAQVVVDLDLRILDVHVRYPGSVHDVRVLHNSQLFRRAESGELFDATPENLPHGVVTRGYLLGDNGYPVACPWIVSPYGGIDQGADEERFDTRQKVARGCVERVFGRLKSTWRLFLSTHKTNLETLPQQFVAVCTLHNILLDAGIDFDENLLWEVDANGVRRRVDLGIVGNDAGARGWCTNVEGELLRDALRDCLALM
ncbi:hypothetical protein CBR_g47096 [Chara braunii]|uniref:DDE Tnp4 domain-containing protein n=1 Tax=Chara braunii TaxID=69332 RepID=A0A388M1D6_CHABU|nr:hypothetical protein CBR_g47096 [Chara braunii]|eukprot:GBG88397.1 hypothetical protein CBR_g47096 [Chara braunii]